MGVRYLIKTLSGYRDFKGKKNIYMTVTAVKSNGHCVIRGGCNGWYKLVSERYNASNRKARAQLLHSTRAAKYYY